MESADIIIVGAGLSGIAAGYYFQHKCPSKSFVIVEARDCIGGTWDLFRYPGIRSDSDMYTLGYSFKPWTDRKAIADADVILKYIRETADEYNITKKIRFHHRVKKANWSSSDNQWHLDIEVFDSANSATSTKTMKSKFLFMCSGYYDYNQGHNPEFVDKEKFKGKIVHPQHWPENLDYTEKNVAVIGSGATAVTLLPQLAKKAAHVTMVQRSPTYVVSRPSEDSIAKFFRRWLPLRCAYFCTRWFHILTGLYFYNFAKAHPKLVRDAIIKMCGNVIGAENAARHFSPSYNPWDQRLCLVPDQDMFLAIKEGKASVVTDTIDRFVEDGILLSSGETVKADVIVTATGLKIVLLGGMEIFVDDKKVNISDCWSYKHMMLSGVPNFGSCFGYPNAAWTLKAELNCIYFCRLVNYMDHARLSSFVPVQSDPSMPAEPWLQLSSGYIQRAANVFPKRGVAAPWKPASNYLMDLLELTWGGICDKNIVFSK